MTKDADVDVARRWIRAGREGDWITFGALLDEHATYRFHSQWEAVGRDAIVEQERNHVIPGLSISQDAFVADGSGRVWFRYVASWPDPATGATSSTSGASTVVIVGGLIVEFESWIDLGFMLAGSP